MSELSVIQMGCHWCCGCYQILGLPPSANVHSLYQTTVWYPWPISISQCIQFISVHWLVSLAYLPQPMYTVYLRPQVGILGLSPSANVHSLSQTTDWNPWPTSLSQCILFISDHSLVSLAFLHQPMHTVYLRPQFGILGLSPSANAYCLSQTTVWYPWPFSISQCILFISDHRMKSLAYLPQPMYTVYLRPQVGILGLPPSANVHCLSQTTVWYPWPISLSQCTQFVSDHSLEPWPISLSQCIQFISDHWLVSLAYLPQPMYTVYLRPLVGILGLSPSAYVHSLSQTTVWYPWPTSLSQCTLFISDHSLVSLAYLPQPMYTVYLSPLVGILGLSPSANVYSLSQTTVWYPWPISLSQCTLFISDHSLVSLAYLPQPMYTVYLSPLVGILGLSPSANVHSWNPWPISLSQCLRPQFGILGLSPSANVYSLSQTTGWYPWPISLSQCIQFISDHWLVSLAYLPQPMYTVYLRPQFGILGLPPSANVHCLSQTTVWYPWPISLSQCIQFISVHWLVSLAYLPQPMYTVYLRPQFGILGLPPSANVHCLSQTTVWYPWPISLSQCIQFISVHWLVSLAYLPQPMYTVYLRPQFDILGLSPSANVHSLSQTTVWNPWPISLSQCTQFISDHWLVSLAYLPQPMYTVYLRPLVGILGLSPSANVYSLSQTTGWYPWPISLSLCTQFISDHSLVSLAYLPQPMYTVYLRPQFGILGLSPSANVYSLSQSTGWYPWPISLSQCTQFVSDHSLESLAYLPQPMYTVCLRPQFGILGLSPSANVHSLSQTTGWYPWPISLSQCTQFVSDHWLVSLAYLHRPMYTVYLRPQVGILGLSPSANVHCLSQTTVWYPWPFSLSLCTQFISDHSLVSLAYLPQPMYTVYLSPLVGILGLSPSANVHSLSQTTGWNPWPISLSQCTLFVSDHSLVSLAFLPQPMYTVYLRPQFGILGLSPSANVYSLSQSTGWYPWPISLSLCTLFISDHSLVSLAYLPQPMYTVYLRPQFGILGLPPSANVHSLSQTNQYGYFSYLTPCKDCG